MFVAVFALLAAIAIPNFLRARKRSQATRVLEDLRLIDAAIDQYSIEHNKDSGAPVGWADVQTYLRPGRLSQSGTDILGNSFGTQFKVDSMVPVPAKTYEALSDVAPADFWDPFPVEKGSPAH